MVIEESPKSADSSSTPVGEDEQPRISQQELRRRVSRMRYDHSTGEEISYPKLNSAEALKDWLPRMETELSASGIPQTQWSDAAILFLEGSVNIAMRAQRQRRTDTGILVWPWDEFTTALLEVVVEDTKPSALEIFRKEHPVATTTAAVAAGTGLVVVGSTMLAPALVVGGLHAIGFTAGGVAGGSIAAGLHSAFYGMSAIGTIAAGATILNSRTDEDDSNPGPPESLDGRASRTPSPHPIIEDKGSNSKPSESTAEMESCTPSPHPIIEDKGSNSKPSESTAGMESCTSSTPPQYEH
ncbi:hypothetical protein BDZ97DRAFT_1922607 [Flammula alnicola]|nr:hypothetical protein BDZ97DRAFT_1922607 [Flammula alnicola]